VLKVVGGGGMFIGRTKKKPCAIHKEAPNLFEGTPKP